VFKIQDKKVTLNLSLYTFCRHTEVQLVIFLTSALIGGEWSVSRRGHFTLERKQAPIEWEVG
jgi:hypothetical protein